MNQVTHSARLILGLIRGVFLAGLLIAVPLWGAFALATRAGEATGESVSDAPRDAVHVLESNLQSIAATARDAAHRGQPLTGPQVKELFKRMSWPAGPGQYEVFCRAPVNQIWFIECRPGTALAEPTWSDRLTRLQFTPISYPTYSLFAFDLRVVKTTPESLSKPSPMVESLKSHHARAVALAEHAVHTHVVDMAE